MYKKSVSSWLKHWDFMVMDILVLHLCVLLSFDLIWNEGIPYMNMRFRTIALLFLLCQLAVMFFTQPYKGILKRGNAAELGLSLRHTLSVLASYVIATFVLHQQHIFSRRFIAACMVLYAAATFLTRFGLKKFVMHRLRITKTKSAMVVITTSSMIKDVINNLTKSELYDYFISGIVLVDRNVKNRKIAGIPVLENNDDILGQISREWVDEVFICLPDELALSDDAKEKLISMGVTTHYCLAELQDDSWGERHVQSLGDYAVVTSGMKMVAPKDLLYKRLLDIVGAIVGCIICGILFIFVAPAIYMKSPGPIFFSQTRIGLNGKPFKIYKFRSMYMDAEERKAALLAQSEVDSVMFKMEDDPRIIGSEKKDRNGKPKGIGNFIRKTSIDEFPQFFNVLKGDMSLVGTRPPTVDEWERYDIQHRARMRVKPGITGLWQVSGRSNIESMDEVVRLDKEYIQNWSMKLDIAILFKTVKVVLLHEGAV
ncbi:MAG: sugar transferase [Lachnospiraceae bacterium]|nr:sugar transferase [Lachnospiraceae bacterium]